MAETESSLKIMRDVTKNYLKNFILVSKMFLSDLKTPLETYIEIFSRVDPIDANNNGYNMEFNRKMLFNIYKYMETISKNQSLLDNFSKDILKIEHIETIKSVVISIIDKVLSFLYELYYVLIRIDIYLIHSNFFIYNLTRNLKLSIKIYKKNLHLLNTNQLLPMGNLKLLRIFTSMSLINFEFDFVKLKFAILNCSLRPSFNKYLSEWKVDKTKTYTQRNDYVDYDKLKITWETHVADECLKDSLLEVFDKIEIMWPYLFQIIKKLNIYIEAKDGEGESGSEDVVFYEDKDDEIYQKLIKLDKKIDSTLRKINFNHIFKNEAINLLMSQIQQELVNLSDSANFKNYEDSNEMRYGLDTSRELRVIPPDELDENNFNLAPTILQFVNIKLSKADLKLSANRMNLSYIEMLKLSKDQILKIVDIINDYYSFYDDPDDKENLLSNLEVYYFLDSEKKIVTCNVLGIDDKGVPV